MKAVCKDLESRLLIFYAPEVVETTELSSGAITERQSRCSGFPEFELNIPFFHIQRLTTELKISLADLAPDLAAHRDRSLYIRKARHWNREGQRVAARAILETLIETEQIPHSLTYRE